MVIQQRQVRAEVALFWGGEVREGGGVVKEVEGVFVDLGLGVVSCELARDVDVDVEGGEWRGDGGMEGGGNLLLPSAPASKPVRET